MDLSIVIPLINEEKSLEELYDWIVRVVQSNSFSYEIIFVDDGSTDKSWEIIESLAKRNKNVKGIQFQKNFGKSQALHAAFKKVKADIVITMDADLQDSPEEIPKLVYKIKNEDYDLVSGWKKKRFDPKIKKNIPSKLFNWAVRKTSGLNLNDFNCGLKAYKKTVVKDIEVYGEMHRYIPVLAKNAGYYRIGEQIVQHQARKYGTSKFGTDRFINSFLDLISIWFLSKFGKRPMHFFGLLGTIVFLIGSLAVAYIGLSKLYYIYAGLESILITNNPWFYIALTNMIIGTQLFLAGFTGEIILRNRANEMRYKIKKEV